MGDRTFDRRAQARARPGHPIFVSTHTNPTTARPAPHSNQNQGLSSTNDKSSSKRSSPIGYLSNEAPFNGPLALAKDWQLLRAQHPLLRLDLLQQRIDLLFALQRVQPAVDVVAHDLALGAAYGLRVSHLRLHAVQRMVLAGGR